MEFPGEKLVIRLWETIAEKGIGGWLRPWQIRRVERARIDIQRETLLGLAHIERDIKDIRSGRRHLGPDDQLVELSEQANREDSALRDAVSSVQRNRMAREMRGEVNVSKALLSAETILEDDPQTPPEHKVDDD